MVGIGNIIVISLGIITGLLSLWGACTATYTGKAVRLHKKPEGARPPIKPGKQKPVMPKGAGGGFAATWASRKRNHRKVRKKCQLKQM
jgi:hypothetical protein